MRISREAMLMDMCEVIAKRSTCNRGNIGAIVWDPQRRDIVSIGYNGSPSGQPHCIDVGCQVDPGPGCSRTDHAEKNAIRRAQDERKTYLQECHLYCTSSPCSECAIEIRDSRIQTLLYRHPYRDKSGIERLLDFTNINIYRVMPNGVIWNERSNLIVT